MVYIFGNWSFPFFFASLYSLITRRKYIVSPRTSFMRETWKGKFLKKLIYHILFERFLIQKSNAIHYTTLFEQNESEWLKLSTNKVIIPNPVNLNEFENLPQKGVFRKEYKIPNEYNLFVYLGRIEKRKGIDLSVKAFSIINSKNPDAYFVIAGPEEDDYLKDLQELIDGLGLQNRVIFTGYLNEYERIKLLRDADIFILTSFSENFGMSVVEAMACGLPVIVSNKVGISNIINENNAGLVTDLNINNISDAMSTLLNSKDLRTKMANNAIVTANEKFSIPAIAKFMDNSLKKILEYSD
jgi:glycosyltransferase involved in cell wall biosynthesis